MIGHDALRFRQHGVHGPDHARPQLTAGLELSENVDGINLQTEGQRKPQNRRDPSGPENEAFGRAVHDRVEPSLDFQVQPSPCGENVLHGCVDSPRPIREQLGQLLRHVCGLRRQRLRFSGSRLAEGRGDRLSHGGAQVRRRITIQVLQNAHHFLGPDGRRETTAQSHARVCHGRVLEHGCRELPRARGHIDVHATEQFFHADAKVPSAKAEQRRGCLDQNRQLKAQQQHDSREAQNAIELIETHGNVLRRNVSALRTCDLS